MQRYCLTAQRSDSGAVSWTENHTSTYPEEGVLWKCLRQARRPCLPLARRSQGRFKGAHPSSCGKPFRNVVVEYDREWMWEHLAGRSMS